MIREILQRLRDWGRRPTLDRELGEELEFHRSMLERDAISEGAEPAAARTAAARKLGNVTQVHEASRRRWSIPFVEQAVRDVSYALRGLRRAPGFTFTVVMTLALGLGVNAAMFNVTDGLLFRPLSYLRDPGTVHRLYWQWNSGGGVATTSASPYTRYLDVVNNTSSFSQLAAYYEQMLAVGDGVETTERRVSAVSASYFDFFDAPPVLGRYFTAEEDQTPRGADVVVLSHAFWQSEYGGRNVLGDALQVGNVRATIIGVAPRDFSGVFDANPVLMWLPITTFAGSGGDDDASTYFLDYRWGWMRTLARRNADVSVEQAAADVSLAYQQSWDRAQQLEPELDSSSVAKPRAIVAAIRAGSGPVPSQESNTTRWVALVSLLVLLIAAANVGNLVIARALRRQRETAVRLALGASSGRLFVQMLVESGVLTALSLIVAIGIGYWTNLALARLFVTNAAGVEALSFLNARTLGVTLVLALVVMLITSVLPAFLIRRGNLSERMRGGARGEMRQGSRLRASLLLVQGTLSTLLLIFGALFLQSFDTVRTLPLGYDAERVLLVRQVIRGDAPGRSAVMARIQEMVNTANALPDVETASWAATVPFYATSNTNIIVPGIEDANSMGRFTYQVATQDYFPTMGTRILRGRGFEATDQLGAEPIVVVSESMAGVLWPGRDAIGECFRMRADTAPCLRVVGVAEDMIQNDLTATEHYNYYIPLPQSARTIGNYMLIKTRGDPGVVGDRIRRELQGLLPGESYLTAQPLQDIIGGQQRAWRLGATLFSLFGVLAVIVAGVGLYGVIGYNVTQRLHELGVRAALGASRFNIIRLVVGQSVRYVLAGVVGGIAVAVYLADRIEPLLFQQPAIDPLLYGLVALFMVSVALFASALPARRAARVDPAGALRAE